MGGCESKRVNKIDKNNDREKQDAILRIYRDTKPPIDKLDDLNFVMAINLQKQPNSAPPLMAIPNLDLKFQQQRDKLVIIGIQKPFQLQITRNNKNISLSLTKTSTRIKQLFKEKQQIPFKLGETYKIGMTYFTYYNFVTIQEQRNFRSLNPQIISGSKKIKQSEMEIQQVCIDCNQPQTSNNRFVNFCACEPNKKNIHLECFKEKIIFDYKNDKIKQNSIIINTRRQKCSNCQASFIDFEAFNEFVCQLQRTYKEVLFPLLILRAKVNINGEDLTSYFIHSFQKNNSFTIGRSDKCELQIQIDGSLSKEHAKISLRQKNIYLTDVGSTYGTAKIIPNQFEFQKSESYDLKIYDKVFSFGPQKTQ